MNSEDELGAAERRRAEQRRARLERLSACDRDQAARLENNFQQVECVRAIAARITDGSGTQDELLALYRAAGALENEADRLLEQLTDAGVRTGGR